MIQKNKVNSSKYSNTKVVEFRDLYLFIYKYKSYESHI